MTPKEKAQDLTVNFYTEEINENHDLMTWAAAKECALICVDEILNTESLANRICGYTTLTKSHVQYWEEVKQEIEKL